MAHIGKNTHRLSSNPLEKTFHDAWKEENKYGNLLEYILGDNNEKAVLSNRDEMVAASVVQWLGSPVGEDFVRSILALKDM